MRCGMVLAAPRLEAVSREDGEAKVDEPHGRLAAPHEAEVLRLDVAVVRDISHDLHP